MGKGKISKEIAVMLGLLLMFLFGVSSWLVQSIFVDFMGGDKLRTLGIVLAMVFALLFILGRNTKMIKIVGKVLD